MLLTKDDQMVKTPTFYVFKMYIPHMEARLVPVKVDCEVLEVHGRKAPLVSVTASQKDGVTTVSLANISLDKAADIDLDLGGIAASKVKGEIIASKDIHDYNDFGHAEKVKLAPFDGAKIKNGKLTLKLPARSIVTLSLN